MSPGKRRSGHVDRVMAFPVGEWEEVQFNGKTYLCRRGAVYFHPRPAPENVDLSIHADKVLADFEATMDAEKAENAEQGTSASAAGADRDDAAWRETYTELAEHLKKEGGYPTQRDGPDDKLGRWVDRQRQEKKNGNMCNRRIELLQNLPDWSWEPHNDAWSKQYTALKERLGRGEGYPSRGTDGPEGKLGKWVDNQRTRKRQGKLSEERIELLQELDDWSWGVGGGQPRKWTKRPAVADPTDN